MAEGEKIFIESLSADFEAPPILNDGKITLTVLQASGQTLIFKYNLVNNELPVTMHYKIFIWQQSPGIVPYGNTPVATAGFQVDQQQGSVVVSNLSLGTKSYCIGVAVGPNAKDVCSVFWTSPSSTQPDAPPNESYATTTLTLTTAISDVVGVRLSTPHGYTGKTFGGAVMLVSGDVPPLAQSPVIATVTVPTDAAANDITFSNVGGASGQDYTVAYYTDPTNWTSLTSYVTFTMP